MTAVFSAATALTPLDTTSASSPGRFAATLDPGWTIGGKPNGGYLLAILGRAGAAVSAHDHVIAASAHYLRAPEPGPVEIEVEVLRVGRSADQVRVRMLQDGRACVESLLLVGTLEAGTEPYWDSGAPARGEEFFDDAVRLPGANPSGLRVAMMDTVDIRMDRSSLGWTRGEPDGHGELRGWVALPGDETFDTASLLYAVDAFPPATFDVAVTGWVPTLELTAYVRALPAPGPVRVIQRARLVEGQRVDEECWVWDSRGRVVAQCTQLAAIRLG